MYVVSYDITSDRLRNKIAKTLGGYGIRIQYSVFECRLDEKKYKKLYRELMKLMAEEEGNIRIYSICGKCEERICMIGQTAVRTDPIKEPVIVI